MSDQYTTRLGPGIYRVGTTQDPIADSVYNVFTQQSGINTNFYLTFVGTSSTISTKNRIYTNSQLAYNPSTNTLSFSTATFSISNSITNENIVGFGSTEIVFNKSLEINGDLIVNGNFELPNVTAKNISGGTSGDILYQYSSGITSFLSPGQVDYVLTSNGPGFAPSWKPSTGDVGAVSTSDSRLTDSREWSAETVGQAEAEAGTATTRRAWTAQRVAQAIAAQASGASPAGTGSEIQFRSSSTALGAIAGSSVDGSGNVVLGSRFTSTVNGAANAPALALTGTIFSGGTAATTKPLFLIEPANVTPATFNTAGTLIGVNTPADFGGDIFIFKKNNTERFKLAADGTLTIGNSIFNIPSNSIALSVYLTSLRLFSGMVRLTGSDKSGQVEQTLLEAGNSEVRTSFPIRLYNRNTSQSDYDRLGISVAQGTTDAVFTATISGTTMTVTSVSSGTIAVDNVVTGGTILEGTRIVSFVSGSGGVGTYTISQSQSRSSATYTTGRPVYIVGTENSGTGQARTLEVVTGNVTRAQWSSDGVYRYAQPAPAEITSSVDLSASDLKNGIIVVDSVTSVSLTLPIGTSVEGGFNINSDNLTHEWTIINTGSNAATIIAATDHTIVGSSTVSAGTSARFATRRSAANTYITYRIS